MPLMYCFPSTALKGKYLGSFQLCSSTYCAVRADLSVHGRFHAVGFTGGLCALVQLLMQGGFPDAECKMSSPSRSEF